MRNFILAASFVFIVSKTFSQAGNWDVYMAQFEKGAGSITLNMDLVKVAPKSTLPYVLVTGVTIGKCREDGLPISEEFDKLYQISDAVEMKLRELTNYEFAGTFTYQCQRLDYIYVSDTASIRAKLTKIYENEFPGYKYHIRMRADAAWAAYLQFLYPNEVTQEYMANEKILLQLQRSGDDLTTPRQVDHWFYFLNKEHMNLFIAFAKKEGFNIEASDRIMGNPLPFQLQISRTEDLNPNEISKVTLNLRQKAKDLNGKYDGWETFVVTK
jgi:uncharacterized protein (TIGR01619 family)